MFPPMIRANGRMMTRNSVSVRPNGAFRLVGIDSIDWTDEVPQELVGGMNNGGPPLGKADGTYTCGANMGIYVDEAPAFEAAILALAPLALGALSKATFQLAILLREDVRVVSVALVNCTLKSRGVSVGNDGSSLVKQYALQPTTVVENGLSLISLLPAL